VTTLRNARSKSSLVPSASASLAISMNRFDCSGSSAFGGGDGLRVMAHDTMRVARGKIRDVMVARMARWYAIVFWVLLATVAAIASVAGMYRDGSPIWLLLLVASAYLLYAAWRAYRATTFVLLDIFGRPLRGERGKRQPK
jgi:hypothetical protein